MAGQSVTTDFQLPIGGLIVDELIVTGTRTQRSALETTYRPGSAPRS